MIFPKVWVGSKGPPGGLGGVGRPSSRSGRDQKALPKVWVESGGTPGGLGGVERPFRRSEMLFRRSGRV